MKNVFPVVGALLMISSVANAAPKARAARKPSSPCQLFNNKEFPGDALKCEEVARKMVKEESGSNSATCENGKAEPQNATEYVFKSTPGGYWLVRCSYAEESGCECDKPHK